MRQDVLSTRIEEGGTPSTRVEGALTPVPKIDSHMDGSAGSDVRSGPLDGNSSHFRGSRHLSCIIRPTVGPVRRVVPGDRRLWRQASPEQHPRCDFGRQLSLDLDGFRAWEGSAAA